MRAKLCSSIVQPAFLSGLHIRDVEKPDEVKTRIYDSYRFPAVIDLHVHGGFGWDFSYGEADRIDEMLDSFMATGLTGIVATLITCPEEQRMKALKAIAEAAARRKKPPKILGVYLEGPFLSPVRRGSHPQELLLQPNLDLVLRWQEQAHGLIKLITIAPELEGSEKLIEELVRRHIYVAIGHSDANHDTAVKAFEAGADRVTHFFNAMKPFSHREPSIVSAVLSHPPAFVELIADGIHIAPEILSMAYRIFGPHRTIFVSDGVALLGLPDGEYDAYNTRLEIKGGRCSYVGGHLFGGGKSLGDCLSFLYKALKIPIEEIAECVGTNPAASLDLSLSKNTEVIFDNDFNWLATHSENLWYWRED